MTPNRSDEQMLEPRVLEERRLRRNASRVYDRPQAHTESSEDILYYLI